MRFVRMRVLKVKADMLALCIPQHAATQSPELCAQHNTLGAKLVLLSLHFPRLRVIWSRSLHATVDLFRALKANQDEPDANTAAAIGTCDATTSVQPWPAVLYCVFSNKLLLMQNDAKMCATQQINIAHEGVVAVAMCGSTYCNRSTYAQGLPPIMSPSYQCMHVARVVT